MNDIQINERQGIVRTALTKLNRQDTNMNSPPNSKVTSTWKSADELFGNFVNYEILRKKLVKISNSIVADEIETL